MCRLPANMPSSQTRGQNFKQNILKQSVKLCLSVGQDCKIDWLDESFLGPACRERESEKKREKV